MPIAEHGAGAGEAGLGELGGEGDEERGDDEGEDGGQEERGEGGEGAPLPAGFGEPLRVPHLDRRSECSRSRSRSTFPFRSRLFYFSPMVIVSAPVRPNTSGVYISSTFVGGSTKLPSDVARARYR